jgi:hypothetical protein
LCCSPVTGEHLYEGIVRFDREVEDDLVGGPGEALLDFKIEADGVGGLFSVGSRFGEHLASLT